MKKLFLVVPCFNEAETLPVSLPRMLEVLDSLQAGEGLETGIIIADDGSTDGTAEAAATFPDGRVHHLPLPHSGQQGAILGGVKAALEMGADAVITLDADLQDDPAAIPEMVRMWQGGKDVVYGVRNDRGGDSVFKRTSAWLFYSLMRLADRRHIMGHADFRLMSRASAGTILAKASPSGDLLRNLVPTLGFDSSVVYYSRGDRAAGESKYGFFQMLRFGWKGFVAQTPVCMALVCLFTFTAFFLTSIDSPLHDNMAPHTGWLRFDSAWYFMCGKAWMNGLVPYVDFADSKGPLLWLFYAIAWLISPRSWAGVFWINALAYVITSAILFKASLILSGSPKKSMWMGMLLSVVYFVPLFIFDDKSEVMTLPFLALSMLVACKSLYGEGGSFFWWGFSFGAIVLIKYSVAAMSGIFLIAMLSTLTSWKAFFKAAGEGIAGFAAIVAPFLVWFLCTGSFGAFIHEYFVITFRTIGNIVGSNDKGEFFRTEMVGYWTLALSGSVCAAFMVKRAKWFPPVAAVWFLLCLSGFARTYYFIPMNVLMVFTALAIVRCFDRDSGKIRFIMAPLLAAAVFYFAYTNAWTYRHDYFYGKKMTLQRERAKQYIDVMAGEEKPRVLYWDCGDHGFGIKAGDLPACKYWSLQAGATGEMYEDQWNAAKNRLADIVFVRVYDRERQELLKEWGYERCPKPEFGRYRVFRRRPNNPVE